MAAEREIDEFIGVAQGILAGGIMSQAEAAVLLNWLRTNRRRETRDLAANTRR